MVGLGQQVLDPVGDSDAVEDVRAEVAATGAVSVLGQIGEDHAIVGEYEVDLDPFRSDLIETTRSDLKGSKFLILEQIISNQMFTSGWGVLEFVPNLCSFCSRFCQA